jgi:oligosaccharide repeat unit polymerase
MTTIALFLLMAETIGIVVAERNIHKTLLTPTTVLLIPYVCVVLLVVFAGKPLGLLPLHGNSLYIWIIGIIPFWLAGLLIRLITQLKPPPEPIAAFPKENNKLQYFFYILIFFLFLKLIITWRQGLSFGSKEFGEAFIGRGISAHLSNILFIALPYLLLIKRRKKKAGLIFKTAVVISIFLIFIGYGSKTWILTLFISTFLILAHYKQVKVSVMTPVVIIIAGFVFFTVYYSFLINEHVIRFASRHFVVYLTSGVIPLSEYVRNNLDPGISPEYVISPFLNIYHALFGNEVISAHSPIWIVTESRNHFSSNVFTFFGTIYIYTGAWWGIIIAFLLGLINYILLLFSQIKRSVFLTIAYYFSISVLFWGWFNCSFILIRPWEVIIYAILIDSLSMLTIKPTASFHPVFK